MNDNYTCKEKMPQIPPRDADGAYIVSNPWIQWAKLGARVQKHNDFLLKIHSGIVDTVIQNVDDKVKKESMQDLIETIHQSYAVLFEDVITNGVAPDED